MAIKKLWIEEGCIACELCVDNAPEIFEMKDDECSAIKPDAEGLFASLTEEIIEAAGDCPVEVIKWEEEAEEAEAEAKEATS